MEQCLRIILAVPDDDATVLHDLVERNARRLALEGSAQMVTPDKMQIIACGIQESVEQLVDALYENGNQINLSDIEVEPFIKDRDFRGVFRVIE